MAEPKEVAIAAAAKVIAVNDGWRKFEPLTKHVAIAKDVLDAVRKAAPAPWTGAELDACLRGDKHVAADFVYRHMAALRALAT